MSQRVKRVSARKISYAALNETGEVIPSELSMQNSQPEAETAVDNGGRQKQSDHEQGVEMAEHNKHDEHDERVHPSSPMALAPLEDIDRQNVQCLVSLQDHLTPMQENFSDNELDLYVDPGKDDLDDDQITFKRGKRLLKDFESMLQNPE